MKANPPLRKRKKKLLEHSASPLASLAGTEKAAVPQPGFFAQQNHAATIVWQLLLPALCIFLTYGHTLDVPFYLDDFSSIRENPVIYQQQGLAALWQYAPLRFIGYLSFYINYAWHQFNPAAYHLVNITLHILTAWVVVWLVRGLLRTPLARTQDDHALLFILPLLTALLFALHPLQIQAVTYVVQRLAAMAALFYLATLAAFIQARLAQAGRQRAWWTGLAVLFALAAFFTKQNTFTLPLAILLVEWVFFRNTLRQMLTPVITGVVLLGILWVILAVTMGYQPFSLKAMQALTQETAEIPRVSYLATQMQVLWLYIRLFFIPLGLHIDYDFPLAGGFLEPGVLFAAICHIALIVLALRLLRRFPVAAFALLFYYLAHSIESSLIPIRDVVFEHRTYLPNFGLALLTAFALYSILSYLDKRLMIASLVLISLFMMATTWQRNQVWRSPLKLWRESTLQSPEKSRPWAILGKHLLQAGQAKEGGDALERAILIQQKQSAAVKTTDVINLIVALKMQGRYKQAMMITEDVIHQEKNPLLSSKLWINKGNIHFAQEQIEAAEAAYRHALRIYPASLHARINLASIYGRRNQFKEAEALYLEALQYDPDSPEIQNNLRIIRDHMKKRP